MRGYGDTGGHGEVKGHGGAAGTWRDEEIWGLWGCVGDAGMHRGHGDVWGHSDMETWEHMRTGRNCRDTGTLGG